MVDVQPKQSMSDTHRRQRKADSLPSVPTCENCQFARRFEEFCERTEGRLTAGDLRMAGNEAAIARVAGAVDTIPDVINAKFDSLITVLKTRDSIIAAERAGKDIENKTPKPELKFGQASIRASASTIVLVVLVLTLVGGGIAGTAYVVVERGKTGQGK